MCHRVLEHLDPTDREHVCVLSGVIGMIVRLPSMLHPDRSHRVLTAIIAMSGGLVERAPYRPTLGTLPCDDGTEDRVIAWFKGLIAHITYRFTPE
jgi:hypothetical protein